MNRPTQKQSWFKIHLPSGQLNNRDVTLCCVVLCSGPWCKKVNKKQHIIGRKEERRKKKTPNRKRSREKIRIRGSHLALRLEEPLWKVEPKTLRGLPEKGNEVILEGEEKRQAWEKRWSINSRDWRSPDRKWTRAPGDSDKRYAKHSF